MLSLESLYRVPTHSTHMATKKAKKPKDNESPLYFPWMVMCNSCSNPHAKAYKDLGARGIFVCDEWKDDFKAFEEWSLKHGWEDGLKIDRYDLDGPFSPDNCAWGKIKREAPEPDVVIAPVLLKPKEREVPKLEKGQTTLLQFI